MSPDELRRRADRLDDALTHGAPPVTRDDEIVIAEVPSGSGIVMRITFQPSLQPGRSATFWQLFRQRADGRLFSTSGLMRLDAGMLPGVADALARALELSEETLVAARARRHQGTRRPEQPQHTNGSAAAHANGTTAPNHHDDRRDDQHDDGHHDDAA